MVRAIALLALLLLAGERRAEGAPRVEDWPQWRGPNRDGTSREKGWRAVWPAAGPKVCWKVNVGRGYAAVSVVGSRLYTAGNHKNTDTVWCLDAKTGDTIWKYSYPCPGAGGGFPGPRVTPTVDGDLLYTVSVLGQVFCLEAKTGNLRWSVDTGNMNRTRGPPYWHGASCHPLIEKDLLILEVGAEGGNFAAFNKRTGKLVWQAGDQRLGYSSPVCADINGVRTLVAFSGSAIVGMDPFTGSQLWAFPCKVEFQGSIATPVVFNDQVFVSSFYFDQAGVLLRIEDGRPSVVWQTREMQNHFNACVLWKGHLYGFHGYARKQDSSRGDAYLGCLNARTGKLTWSQDVGGVGGLMMADGNLILLTEPGELMVAEASPKRFKPVSRAHVIGEHCWTMPVLSHGRIYCRNHRGDVVCLDVRR